LAFRKKGILSAPIELMMLMTNLVRADIPFRGKRVSRRQS
jgi:hypothetical protein